MIKSIPKIKKCKKAKWLSEEALQIAEKRRKAKGKGEKERYIHQNTEFQRKLDTKGIFQAKMGTIKDRNGMDLKEVENIKKGSKNTQKNYIKKILMTQITMIV